MPLYICWIPNIEPNALETPNIVINLWTPKQKGTYNMDHCNKSHKLAQFFLSSDLCATSVMNLC